MKFLVPIAVIVAALMVQLTIFGHMRPLGVMPNLVLVALILCALWSDATPTLTASVTAGLLTDMASGSDFGLRPAFFTLTALVVIAVRQLGLHPESIIPATAMVLGATLLFNGAILATVGQPFDVGYAGHHVAAESLINVICMAAVYIGRELLVDRRSRVMAELNRRSWR